MSCHSVRVRVRTRVPGYHFESKTQRERGCKAAFSTINAKMSAPSSSFAPPGRPGATPAPDEAPHSIPLKVLLRNAVFRARRRIRGLVSTLPGEVTDNAKKRKIREVCLSTLQQLIRLRALCTYMRNEERGGRLRDARAAVQEGGERTSYVSAAHSMLGKVYGDENNKPVPLDARTADALAPAPTHLPSHPFVQIPALRPLVEAWSVPSHDEILGKMNRNLERALQRSQAKHMYTSVSVRGGRVELLQKGEFRVEITRGTHDGLWHVLRADLLFAQRRRPSSLHARPYVSALRQAVDYIFEHKGREQDVIHLLRRRHPTWNVDLALVEEIYGTIGLEKRLKSVTQTVNCSYL